MDDTATRATAPTASLLRAWCYLVWLSWQRQMRARQMVWIALGLRGFATLCVSINTWLGVWDMRNWRLPDRAAPTVLPTILSPFSLQVQVFVVRGVVFGFFLNILLPLWSLSFATEAMGGDRESNSLIWLLTRPLPRPAIYLGKYVA